MTRPVRIALIVAGVAALGFLLLVAAAWLLMPSDWIDREAKKRAAEIEGATVRWNRLQPGFTWLALGVRIEGLYVRVPDETAGEAELEARVREIFVSFQLLPLLSRRVEVSAARVSGAGIAMTERRAASDSAAAMPPKPRSPAGVALLLPRLDLDEVDIRTRDLVGGGFDIRRLSGRAQVDGTIDRPRAIRVFAKAESLLWKPSATAASLLLPSPLLVDAVAQGDPTGARLVVEQGSVHLGPLESKLAGEILLSPDAGPRLALSVTGSPQSIRSDADAFRALAAAWPVAWSTNASWDVRIEGPAATPTQTGSVTLKPISVTSGGNTFSLAQAVATWSTSPDRTYTARVDAADKGLEFSFGARGSTLPGGSTSGTWNARADAVRLNGLMPNLPTWRGGTLATRGVFTLEPPAAPSLGWTALGADLRGDVPGLTRPLGGMAFDIRGDDKSISIRSFRATVGSTTASLTGTVLPGKPLGSGAFRASLDRFVAEEWAPPKPVAGSAPATQAAAPPAGPPPIPLRAFDAMVTIGELRSGTLTVRDVVVPVRYAEGNLEAAPITGRVGTGSIDGGLQLNNLLAKPSYALNLNVKRAPVEEFMAGLLPFQLGLTGFASGTVDLAGPGMPGTGAADSLRGSLVGTVEQGKILETPAVAGLRDALGLGSGSQADLVFKTLTHSLRIDAGRLLLDQVKGDVGKDLFEMTGSMGLDKSLNVDLLLRLASDRIKGGTALAEIARYARDKDGRLPLNIKVTGTTMAPTFSVKTGKALDVAGERLKEEITRSLAGGQRDSAGADSAATAEDDPLRKAREALERLLGK